MYMYMYNIYIYIYLFIYKYLYIIIYVLIYIFNNLLMRHPSSPGLERNLAVGNLVNLVITPEVLSQLDFFFLLCRNLGRGRFWRIEGASGGGRYHSPN